MFLLPGTTLAAVGSNLLTDSPFLPSGYHAKLPAQPVVPPPSTLKKAIPYTYHGYMDLGQVQIFSLQMIGTNEGILLRSDEAGSGDISVLSHTPDGRSVTVEYYHAEYTLEMNQDDLAGLDIQRGSMLVVSSSGSKNAEEPMRTAFLPKVSRKPKPEPIPDIVLTYEQQQEIQRNLPQGVGLDGTYNPQPTAQASYEGVHMASSRPSADRPKLLPQVNNALTGEELAARKAGASN